MRYRAPTALHGMYIVQVVHEGARRLRTRALLGNGGLASPPSACTPDRIGHDPALEPSPARFPSKAETPAENRNRMQCPPRPNKRRTPATPWQGAAIPRRRVVALVGMDLFFARHVGTAEIAMFSSQQRRACRSTWHSFRSISPSGPGRSARRAASRCHPRSPLLGVRKMRRQEDWVPHMKRRARRSKRYPTPVQKKEAACAM